MNASWTDDPGFVAILLLTFALGLGFMFGALRNKRLLELYVQRLRPAFLAHAGKATARRLGTSGYHVSAPNAKKPFRAIEAMIFVQPREFTPYWLFNVLRGRGDRLFLHVTLRHPPAQRVLAGPGVRPPAQEDAWQTHPSPWPGTLYAVGDPTPEMEDFLHQVAALLPHLSQISIRAEAPHISLLVPMRDLDTPQKAREVLDLLARVPTA